MSEIALARSPSFATRFNLAVPYLAMFGSIGSFCLGTTFAKHLYPLVGAQGAVAYRVGFAALMLLAVFRPWRQPLSRKDLLAVARYGVALGFMNLNFYMAIRTIPLGLAIAIEFMGPLTVSVIHARSRAHFAAIGLAVAGLVLLTPLKGSAHAIDPTGALFAVAAGVCWGLYIVFGQRTAHLHGGQSVSLGMTIAALVVVPIGVHGAGPGLFKPSMMVLGLIPGLLSSAIPYSLEMIAMKRVPANTFGVMLSMEPAVGALAGAIILGEQLSLRQWSAIGLIVMASVLAVRAAGGVAGHEPASETDCLV